MNLAQISWPVFKLGEHKPQQHDGIVFYSKQYQDQHTLELRIGMRIVDDKNIDKPTLGMRRLILKQQEVKLFNIKKAVYFIQDLIKLSKQTTWWIDSNGAIFQYKKYTRAKLICKRIKKILPAKVTGCILEVEGLSQRFKLIFPPKNGEQYAGILQWGLGYIIYGIYSKPFKTTYRLV